MKFSNETLMAYADGELDLVLRAEIEAAMASDPEVARAVSRHRALATRVKSAYQGVLEEAVPPQLASLTAAPVSAPVVYLAEKRAAIKAAAEAAVAWRSRLPQWSAIAASVAVGLFVGILVMRGPVEPWEDSASGLIARGELDAALTTKLAGDSGAANVRVGISFRDRTGDYCRTFHLQREAPLAGLACRAEDGWRVQVLAAAPMEQNGLQPAGAMPMAVLLAVDAAIDGEPLDAPAESAARDAGWQNQQ